MSVLNPLSILSHLDEFLPRFGDDFCDLTSVVATILAGDPQTLSVTQPAHGLNVGSKVIFVGSKIPNDITAVSAFTDGDDTGFRFTTDSEHDLTLDYSPTVELSGFTNASLNGFHDLYGVPNRTSFEILSDEALPTLTGSEQLQESWEVGLDGTFTVATAPTVDTYTIELTGKPEFQTGEITLNVATNLRIDIAADFSRVEAKYTKQAPDDLWCYLIMDDAVISKDRLVKSDGTATNTEQNTQRLRSINDFTVVIIFPTASNDVGGANAVVRAWTDIHDQMVAILSGWNPNPLEGNTPFVTSIISHGSTVYNSAYYGHAYGFQYVADLTQDNAFTTQFITSRAARDVGLNLSEPSDGSNADLDVEP